MSVPSTRKPPKNQVSGRRTYRILKEYPDLPYSVCGAR